MTDQPKLPVTARDLYIDGKWVPAQEERRFSTHNPSTGELLAEVAEGAAADIDLAVAAARRAFEGPWRHFTPFERQERLLRLAELVEKNWSELALIDTLDMGAPLQRTSGNYRRGVGLLRFYAGLATAIQGDTIIPSVPGNILAYTLKEPVGVVGAIIPWNSPTIALLWKLAPALAAGCTIVFKPAEQAPLASLRLTELIDQIDLPRGVFNLVNGFGATAGAALAAHEGVDKIAFTGSSETGRKIVEASAGNLKRVSLELGGKSPDIVFADANIDLAVKGAAMAAFANSGQICCAGTRLFVEREIHDEFVERVAEIGRGLRVGNSLDPETEIGPLVSEQQLDRVMGYFRIGAEEGARAVSGNSRLTGDVHAGGWFVAPTVLADVRDDMRVAREEIFGPVVAAIPFDDIDEAIRRGNDSMFGLGSGVWTRDIGKAQQVARGLRTGTVWVNCYNLLDPAVPFGGYKMSGYGRESGVQHLDEFLNTKAVWLNGA